jgi:hypothetical protein
VYGFPQADATCQADVLRFRPPIAEIPPFAGASGATPRLTSSPDHVKLVGSAPELMAPKSGWRRGFLRLTGVLTGSRGSLAQWPNLRMSRNLRMSSAPIKAT